MATVYKAFDTRLEADVAVKVIRTDNLAPNVLDRVRKRFDREAKALAKLTHPNIVKITDYGEHEGVPYLVMPHLPGGTLKERIRQGRTPWQEAVRLLAPIAGALEYAHRQKIVHRDIKPSNVLITDTGAPMLSDFGVAKVLSDSDETHELTGTGMGVGTPEYMAPEQFQGRADSRVDIYALGVVLYEMVTGRKPYIAETPAAVIIKQATEPLPRPNRFAPDLPDSIEKILIKSLAKAPKNRYQKMGEFALALERLVLVGEKENKKREEKLKKEELLQKKRQEKEIRKREEQKQKRILQQKKREEKQYKKKEEQLKKAALQEKKREEKAQKRKLQKKEPIAKLQKPKEHSKKEDKSTVPLKPFLWGFFGIVGLGLLYVAVNWIASLNTAQLSSTSMLTSTSAPTNTTSTSSPEASPRPENTFTPEATATPKLGIGSGWERPADGMTMMYIPEGEFLMGSDNGQEDEKPAHTLYLGAFWIDQTEVTNAMYAKCDSCPLPDNADEYNIAEFANYPVVFVSYYDARIFCDWAGARLPSETEWEKAARGTDGRTFPWGEGINCDRVNYFHKDCYSGSVVEVGLNEDAKSIYGLYEMAGNVREWTSSLYLPYPNDNHADIFPSSNKDRVLRGGSWGDAWTGLRTSNRLSVDSSFVHSRTGFRCARDVTP